MKTKGNADKYHKSFNTKGKKNFGAGTFSAENPHGKRALGDKRQFSH